MSVLIYVLNAVIHRTRINNGFPRVFRATYMIFRENFICAQIQTVCFRQESQRDVGLAELYYNILRYHNAHATGATGRRINVRGITVCAFLGFNFALLYSSQKYTRTYGCSTRARKRNTSYVYTCNELRRKVRDRSAGQRNRRYFRPLFFRTHRRMQSRRKKRYTPCTIDYPRIIQHNVTYCNQ